MSSLKSGLITLFFFNISFLLFSQNTPRPTILPAKISADLLLQPTKASVATDFDFLVGRWSVRYEALGINLHNSEIGIDFGRTLEARKVLGGQGNTDEMIVSSPDHDYKDIWVNIYDPQSRLWKLYFTDERGSTVENPAIGSFQNKTGLFYRSEKLKGRKMLREIKWDVTNADGPICTEAISSNGGKTWRTEKNMHLYKIHNLKDNNGSANKLVTLLELRNYVLQPGQLQNFTDLFEKNFIESQQAVGSYPLGEFRIKGADDHFFWIRGFENMATRKKALTDFYYGPVWKKYKGLANPMLINNDNVHLLKPLDLNDSMNKSNATFNTNWFGKPRGIVVIDFYISNTKLDKLIEFFRRHYASVLTGSGVEHTSFWTSELSTNDFPGLPVFQDRNLLVEITIYKDELEYETKMKLVQLKLSDEQRLEMADLVTLKNTLVVYPSENSFKVD